MSLPFVWRGAKLPGCWITELLGGIAWFGLECLLACLLLRSLGWKVAGLDILDRVYPVTDFLVARDRQA